ncbi:type II secretion system protein, partial [Candidatus Uhrbacteria bacterium]|nr:type II secretion system protein [Candidatus Uhrbacteria bacterium]
YTIHDTHGVILIELMLALGLLTIIGGLITMTLYSGERAGVSALKRTQSVQLGREAMDAAKAVAEEDYYTFYSFSKGSGNPYYPVISASKWTLTTGSETIALDGENYVRTIVIDNVSRDGSGNSESVYNASNDDPSTQKITVTVTHTGTPNVVLTDYYTRWRNTVPAQSDWSGGSGSAGPVTSFSTGYDTDDGNIDATGTAGSIKLKSQ